MTDRNSRAGGDGMISLDDIEDMCSLTRDEIAQVAAHDHITPAAAVAEIEALLHRHGGPQRLHAMLCDDIRAALHAGDLPEARRLFALLRHFLSDHPDAARGAR
jgi:hypothetical protein